MSRAEEQAVAGTPWAMADFKEQWPIKVPWRTFMTFTGTIQRLNSMPVFGIKWWQTLYGEGPNGKMNTTESVGNSNNMMIVKTVE
jgi:hypothetical protein